MKRFYHTEAEMASMFLEEMSPEGRTSMALDEMARAGAQMLLQAMLEAEVAECLGRTRYARGAKGVYRNGSRPRQIKTGAGGIAVRYPKITGGGKGFSSSVIPAYQRLSPRLAETLPHLYAEGLSTRDFERALGPLWGQSGLSPSSISPGQQDALPVL